MRWSRVQHRFPSMPPMYAFANLFFPFPSSDIIYFISFSSILYCVRSIKGPGDCRHMSNLTKSILLWYFYIFLNLHMTKAKNNLFFKSLNGYTCNVLFNSFDHLLNLFVNEWLPLLFTFIVED